MWKKVDARLRAPRCSQMFPLWRHEFDLSPRQLGPERGQDLDSVAELFPQIVGRLELLVIGALDRAIRPSLF